MKKYIIIKKKRDVDNSVSNKEKLKIDNLNNKTNVPKYETHAYVVIGPRNVGKNYYIKKYLKK